VNLKGFHLVFIACASALAFLFGAWALNGSVLAGAARLGAAYGSFAIGLALLVYETWFVRYLRRSR
jgi:hypothetical protein